MGNPTFLDSTIHPFRYYTGSVVLPSEITTIVRTELTANGWVESPTKTFTSPANAAGQYIVLVVTEPTLYRWQVSVYDNTGAGVCTRATALQGSPSSTGVYLFTGRDYLYLETVYSSSGWNVYAFLLDTFPETPGVLTHPVVATGSLEGVSGTPDGYGALNWAFAFDNGGPAVSARTIAPVTFGSTPYSMRMASGRYLYMPLWTYILVGGNSAGDYIMAGKFPQALVGPSAATPGTDWVVPITYSTSATFRAMFQQNSGTPYYRLFLRKS